eukprot:1140211-Pelagomonas_calceolata.AAC.3
MSKLDSLLASAKVVADVRQETAVAIWSAERKLESASGESKEDLMIDLKCLRNKLKREEGHLNILLDAAFSAASKAPSPFGPTDPNPCVSRANDSLWWSDALQRAAKTLGVSWRPGTSSQGSQAQEQAPDSQALLAGQAQAR